ncbi:hypothetical protein LPJ66_005125, partial [Kickxella alabastrina]
MAEFNKPTDSAGTVEVKKTAKRDALMDIEKKWQKDWQESGAFEMDMPEDDSVAPEKLHEVYP